MSAVVGLLALQGDFDRHREAFAELGCETRLVRRPQELDACSHLVIPGGESTTLVRLIDRVGLREPLLDFAAKRPVMGTCAGLILLADRLIEDGCGGHGVEPLRLLDVEVARNGFGRQVDSFTEDLHSLILEDEIPFPAVYIRAPRITAVGGDVDVIARRGDGRADGGEPVGVRYGHLLGLTFHPELTPDRRFHRAFLRLGEAD